MEWKQAALVNFELFLRIRFSSEQKREIFNSPELLEILKMSLYYFYRNPFKRKNNLPFHIFQPVYYRLPDLVKRNIQGFFFKKAFKFEDFFHLPLWNLLEKFRAYLRMRNIKWPNGHDFAFIPTLDLDPTPYLFEVGIIDCEGFSAGVVPTSMEKIMLKNCKSLYMHGYNHRHDWGNMSKHKMEELLDKGKIWLKTKGIYPTGFRSPRLTRSPSLYVALENSGFLYSSTIPDIDLENPASMFSGCGINLPFYPIIKFHEDMRLSNIFEIPVTSPDDILPLYAGWSMEQLKKLYTEKMGFVREKQGVYVFVSHPGLSEGENAAAREELRKFVMDKAAGSNAWITTLDNMYRFWRML